MGSNCIVYCQNVFKPQQNMEEGLGFEETLCVCAYGFLNNSEIFCHCDSEIPVVCILSYCAPFCVIVNLNILLQSHC